ncbi:hypothetical protein [Microbacterium sp.]|uniref:hypothetical protein n=1 Tax=Microbacterium sp. TaxID=51671 RepID=UPI0025DEE23D|nr:hypothetical protein [Microbacterium sp.]
MLDVVYLVAILALFALVALIAQGVEKLGPQPGAPSARTPGRGPQTPAPAPTAAPERGGDSA